MQNIILSVKRKLYPENYIKDVEIVLSRGITKMGKSNKVRINIEINPEKLEEIKKMMEAAGVTTQRELFDNALTLTKWMMRQKKLGKIVGALSDDSNRFTELEMPILEHARQSSIEI